MKKEVEHDPRPPLLICRYRPSHRTAHLPCRCVCVSFVRSMLRSSGDSEESRAQATRFEAEVERKAKALLKANRKLAKDVTRWVDASMAKHEEVTLEGNDAAGGSGGGGALPIPPARQEKGRGDGGVEESKGSGRSAGDGGEEGGVKSWLGGWIR